MAIMDFLKKNLTKTAKYKEAEENLKIQQKLEERQKNSDERELERYLEEERQKQIKQNLEEFRKHRQQEAMKTTVLDGKPLFKGKGNIAGGPATILHNNNKLLSMKKSVKSKGMFFK